MSRPRIPELWIARESSNQLNPVQHRSSPPTTSISKTPSSLAFPPCTTVPQGSTMGRPIRTRRHRPATDVCVYIWPQHSREMLRCQDIHMSTHNILAARARPPRPRMGDCRIRRDSGYPERAGSAFPPGRSIWQVWSGVPGARLAPDDSREKVASFSRSWS